MADGHGFAHPYEYEFGGSIEPSAIHPPLTVVLLAGASLVGLEHHAATAMLGVVTCVAVWLLARLLGGPRAGLLAAAGAALLPGLWVGDGLVMGDSVFALTVTAAVIAALWFRRAPSHGRAALLGVAVAVAALTRGEGLLLVALLAPLVLSRRLVTAVAAFAVALAPWTAYNLSRFEAPVLLANNSGEVLRVANCPSTWTGDLRGFWDIRCFRGGEPPGDEAERAAHWRRQGLAFVGRNLSGLPGVMAARVGRLWDVYRPAQNLRLTATTDGRGVDGARWTRIGLVLLVPVAVAGAWRMRARRRDLVLVAVPVASATLTAAAVYGAPRFRVAAEAALVVIAAVGLAGARDADLASANDTGG